MESPELCPQLNLLYSSRMFQNFLSTWLQNVTCPEHWYPLHDRKITLTSLVFSRLWHATPCISFSPAHTDTHTPYRDLTLAPHNEFHSLQHVHTYYLWLSVVSSTVTCTRCLSALPTVLLKAKSEIFMPLVIWPFRNMVTTEAKSICITQHFYLIMLWNYIQVRKAHNRPC